MVEIVQGVEFYIVISRDIDTKPTLQLVRIGKIGMSLRKSKWVTQYGEYLAVKGKDRFYTFINRNH